MTRIAAWLASLVLLVWAVPSAAHTRSVSYSTWQIDGATSLVVARVSLLDASVLERAGHSRRSGALALHVQDSIRLSAGGRPCEATAPRERGADPEWIDLEWTVRCSGHQELRLTSELLIAENPGHLHLVRARFGATEATEHVLDAHASSVGLSPGAARPSSFSRFVWLGVEHIATGWDHLLFVLMLLLSAKTLRRAAMVVTGFTLGHSVTLSLTALGAVVPREAPVEALIALSIGLLAVENAWLDQDRRRALLPVLAVSAVLVAAATSLALALPVAPALIGVALFSACYFAWLARSAHPELGRAAVAALFGLIHGFGFARVLSSLDLAPARVVRALVGFNFGVELGQVVVVVAAWPVLAAIRRRDHTHRLVPIAASIALGLSCHWFVGRAFGG